MLVFGGAIGAAMLSMPMHFVTNAVHYLKKWMFAKHPCAAHHYGTGAIRGNGPARRGAGIGNGGPRSTDPFLRRGLQLTIDGTDPEIIERIMRIEIDAMVERHKHGKHFFGTLAKFGPGFGLMATLIAQVAMFLHLAGDAAVIGAALAVALTGTLYGCLLQNLIAGPIAEKLAARSHEEAFAKEIILQGVLAIQAGNNPRVVEMRVAEFPEHKTAVDDGQGSVRNFEPQRRGDAEKKRGRTWT